MVHPVYYNSRGQALLIILLVMAVALTIGLSVIARSITDIAISQKEEEAARAFSVAEAGVEQALLATSTGDVTGTLSLGSFTATRSDLVISGGKTFVHPQALATGESASIWLVGHDEDPQSSTYKELICSNDYKCFTNTGDGDLRFCWGKTGTASDATTTPALEVMVFHTTGSGYSNTKVGRAVFDPNTSRRASNKFQAPGTNSCGITGASFAFTADTSLDDLGVSKRTNQSLPGAQVVRVRSFYNTDQTHPVGLNADFSGNGALPQQGTKILSTGTSGNATRKLEVYKLYSDLPSIFDYGVFSGTGGIVK